MTDETARDEAKLIRRCAEGDESAWREFVDSRGRFLTALARRMLARHGMTVAGEDVDEVVGEIFLSLLRRDRLLLRRFDARWRLSTYLGVICRTAVNRLLRRRSKPALPLREPEAIPERVTSVRGPLAELTEEERERVRRELWSAMASLGRRDRLILTLRFFDGLDYRAIAEALGVSPESVGPLLARARGRLARRLPDLPRWM